MKRSMDKKLIWTLLLFFIPISLFPLSSPAQQTDDVEKLNNQIVRLCKESRHREAIPMAERVLAIQEKALGPDHPKTATALNNLADLYFNMGDYAKAEPLFRRSLTIYEKTLGPDHPETATALNNLAVLYHAMGNYSKAWPLYKRSLAIRDKALGPYHPHTALSLNNLAGLYYDMGDYARAEPLFGRSLTIHEKTLGSDHPKTATALNNLAEFYRTLGDYAKAEPLYKRSLAIKEKVLGPDHPDTALSLNNLAALYAATARYSDAFPLMLRAQGIDAKLVDQVMEFASEDQKMKFLATKEDSLYVFLSLVSRYAKDKKDAAAEALTVWFQRRGVVLEAQKRFQDALVYSKDPKVMEKSRELAQIRAQLSKLAFSGPGKEGPDAYRQKVKELEAQNEKLEMELNRLSDPFAKTKKAAKADTRQIASSLLEGSVLIDFVRLPVYKFTAKEKEEKWNPPRYYAFVLPSGKPDDVSLIDLGDAGVIDDLVREFKRDIGNYRGDPRDSEASRVSRMLYDLVFDPIKKELKGVKDIYVSPGGNINLISFEVLQGPDGRCLIEDYAFNYLGTGRDIPSFGMIKSTASKPLIIGNHDYDLDETECNVHQRKKQF